MKKKIVIGSILAVFLLTTLPSISAMVNNDIIIDNEMRAFQSDELLIWVTFGLGISIMIENTGDEDATNVNWDVYISSRRFVFPRKLSGSIPVIPAKESESFRRIPIGWSPFWAGVAEISLHAISSEGYGGYSRAYATIYGPLYVHFVPP